MRNTLTFDGGLHPLELQEYPDGVLIRHDRDLRNERSVSAVAPDPRRPGPPPLASPRISHISPLCRISRTPPWSPPPGPRPPRHGPPCSEKRSNVRTRRSSCSSAPPPMHTHTHTNTHRLTHTNTYIHTHTYTHKYTITHTKTNTNTHTPTLTHSLTLRRTTLVGFLRISVSGLASDFLEESAGSKETRGRDLCW